MKYDGGKQQAKLTKYTSSESFDESTFIDSKELHNYYFRPVSSISSHLDRQFSIKWNSVFYTVEKSKWLPSWATFSECSNKQTISNNNKKSQNDYQILLNEAFGEIKSGEITAILGPSGCGKTTLIKTLFQLGTLKRGNLKGNIIVERRRSSRTTNDSRLVSNCSLNSVESSSSNSNYCPSIVGPLIERDTKSGACEISTNSDNKKGAKNQLNVCIINQNDKLLQCLTVREDLTFVVRLRLRQCQLSSTNNFVNNLSDVNIINEKVAQLADSFKLIDCLDVPIKSISGGEQKRLSVAREIVHRPDVLVLDEPTTGLDSLASLKLVKLLKELLMMDKEPPMAIVLIVHQPQVELFNLFDRVIFMSKCGQTIYNEQPKNVEKILLETTQLQLPNATYNPASYMIEIASSELGFEPVEKLTRYFRQQYLIASKQLNTTNTTSQQQLHVDKCLIKTNNSSCSLGQIKLLTRRHWLCLVRNRSYCRSRLIFHITIPLIMWYIFGEVGKPNACPNYQREIDIKKLVNTMKMDNSIELLQLEARASIENMMLFSMMIFALSINTLTHTSTLIPMSINLIRKETQNSLYPLSSHLIAQTLAELPHETIYPIISLAILFPLTGQLYLDNSNSIVPIDAYIIIIIWRIVIGCVTLVLMNYFMYSLGLLCGAIFVKHLQVAQCFALGSALPYLPLSGYLVRAKHWNVVFQWLSYTSPYRHAMSSLLVARYGFNQCGPCLVADSQSTPSSKWGHVSISGITPQVKRLAQYFITTRARINSGSLNGSSNQDVDLFDTIAERLSRSQTFGLQIKSCQDLRPFIMTTFNLHDYELYLGLISLLIMVITFRLLIYFAIKNHLSSG